MISRVLGNLFNYLFFHLHFKSPWELVAPVSLGTLGSSVIDPWVFKFLCNSFPVTNSLLFKQSVFYLPEAGDFNQNISLYFVPSIVILIRIQWLELKIEPHSCYLYWCSFSSQVLWVVHITRATCSKGSVISQKGYCIFLLVLMYLGSKIEVNVMATPSFIY